MKKGELVILDFSKSRPFWAKSEAKMDKFHNQIGTLFKLAELWNDIGNYWWVWDYSVLLAF